MSRIATIPLQRTMADAIQVAQQRLGVTQIQLATGKKARDFADLGTSAVRNLSAHSMLARQKAETDVSKRVATTLSLYDAHLGGIEAGTGDLRTEMLTAIGTGKTGGLQEAIEFAFDQFRNGLNASDGGKPLFGGTQTTSTPFKPGKLSDLVGQPVATAFEDDGIHVSARIGEGVDMTYGIAASDVGSGIYAAFKTLAETGTIGDTPSAAQLADLSKAVGELTDGLASLRASNAANGRRQAQLEALSARGDQRTLLLTDVIAQNEDADLGQVAIDLAQRKATLQASYTVFSQIAGLSLANFLK